MILAIAGVKKEARQLGRTAVQIMVIWKDFPKRSVSDLEKKKEEENGQCYADISRIFLAEPRAKLVVRLQCVEIILCEQLGGAFCFLLHTGVITSIGNVRSLCVTNAGRVTSNFQLDLIKLYT